MVRIKDENCGKTSPRKCCAEKKSNFYSWFFLTALNSYDEPCSPMDTSDDINISPTLLPVNESDQEVQHGTQQPEPTNPPNSTSFLSMIMRGDCQSL